MNGKLKNLFKDTLIFAIGSLGSKFILFFMVPLYTNYMSKAEYGISEYVFTISNLLIPILSVSIWEGVIRMGLKTGTKRENVLRNGLSVFAASSIVIMLITPLWRFYDAIGPWRMYLSAYAIVYILNQIELNYLKVQEKNKLYSLASIFQTAVLAGLNVFLLVGLRMGIEGYLLSNVIAVLSADLLIFFLGKLGKDLKGGSFDMDLLKQMLAYSGPLIVNNISWWIIHSSDKIMIQTMRSSAELGLYTAASKIPSLINVFVTIFTQAWGVSSIKEMESSNDNKYYSEVFELYSVFLVGCMIALTTVIKPFMHVYVGKEFVESWIFVPLLLLAAVMQAFSSYFGALLGALQKSVKTMTTTLVGGVVNIILNYVLISRIGIWGAIIGTLTAFVVVTLQRRVIVAKYVNLSNSWMKFTLNIFICLAQAVLVSLGIHIVVSSIAAILAFAAINYSKIKDILCQLIEMVSGSKRAKD